MSAEPGVEDRPTRIHIAQDAGTWRKTAEAILKRMPPPPIPLLPEEHVSDLSRYTNRPKITSAEAWQKCAEAIEQHDADACKAYREEIDTLLVFAGLFSAVLTAFTIESYQWLQDDPNDAIIGLLSQLVKAQNSTHRDPAPAGLPGPVSARINAFWFLSLTLSLSAALVAIVCKQWVREFDRHTNQSHRQCVSVRQMKLEGFEGWGVGSIIAAIPLLLQSALGLFALGLIELLWNLQSSVAITALVPTVAAVLFYTLTTLLPGLQVMYDCFRPDSTLSQCPFKSPQSLITLRVLVAVPAVLDRFSRPWDTLRELCVAYVLAPILGPLIWVLDLLSEGNTLDFRDRLQRFRKRTSRLDSWSALDSQINHIRDSYEPDHCEVPLPSCFRGLGWICDHMDQPGIHRRIFLAAWDIVTTPQDSPYTAIAPARMQRSLHVLRSHADKFEGSRIRNLDVYQYPRIRTQPATPYVEALRYAQVVGFDRDFVSELVVHHIMRIDLHSVDIIFHGGVISLNEETRHLILRQILFRGGTTAERIPDVRALILLIGQSLGPSLSPPELACVVAVYFQALHAYNSHIFDDLRGLRQLFLLVARCLAVGNGGDDEELASEQQSVEIETALSGLILALDRCFDRLTTSNAVDRSDCHLAVELVQQSAHRDIYVRLLASAENGPVTPRGDMSAAETRFEQTVGRLARMAEEFRSRAEASRAEPTTPPTAALHGMSADPTEDIRAPPQLEVAVRAPGPFRALDVHETDNHGGTEV